MESPEKHGDPDEATNYTKYPLRRMEISIRKFIQVIDIDLKRLHRHKINVEKFSRLQDWSSLNNEQINASRTIQQIKANVQEIEKCRLQVKDEDLEAFDERILPMKKSALGSVQDFFSIATESSRSAENTPDDVTTMLFPGPGLTLIGHGQSHDDLLQTQVAERPEHSEVAQSWEILQDNLQELNTMIHQFAAAVQDQQEGIDRIENNMEKAQIDVQEGVKQLGKASKYKAAMIPIIGAAIGTAVAGPLGLLVGLKIGGLATVAGGTMGYIGGRFVKKRRQEVTDIELSQLSRASSMPDVKTIEKQETKWSLWGRQRTTTESDT
ncbi:syntaxin-17-like [Dreissena polymorpha]|uniref:syntaxin-17-like n=1 Tax=Dreissena polymorpha TaxID=45954 RepID=UPI002263FEF3|nr:syntaxin-17-like [Dreissena polymorpha]